MLRCCHAASGSISGNSYVLHIDIYNVSYIASGEVKDNCEFVGDFVCGWFQIGKGRRKQKGRGPECKGARAGQLNVGRRTPPANSTVPVIFTLTGQRFGDKFCDRCSSLG